MDLSSSVLEQLRVYDGSLFQNEKVLSLQLQTKSFVWTYASSHLRTDENIQNYLDWNDSFASILIQNFTSAQKHVQEDLERVVSIQVQLLGHGNSLFAKPKLDSLLRGIFQRLLKHDAYKSKQLLTQDPVKIDFVFRELFRLTLSNDVVILFDQPNVHKEDTEVSSKTAPETAKDIFLETAKDITVAAQDILLEAVKDTSPRDTTPTPSPVLEPIVPEVVPVEQLLTKLEETASTMSEARQVQLDVLVDKESDNESIGPLPVRKTESSSVISKAASALSSLTSLKKPNVRTVVFDDDDAKTRISRLSRR